MKKMIIIVAIISALMVALPVTVVKKSDFKEKNTQSAIGTSISQNATNKKDYFRVYDKKSDSITVMSADDYIFGVVSAEMPALYHTEALKAQAVAAYTYACYKRNQNNDKKYDITTDYTVDQSFKSYKQACDDWGKNADEYAKKIKEAVKFVSGQIMVYKDKPILAVYHAVSSGRTYSAKDVWGKEIVYLQAKACESDKLSSNYCKKTKFTNKQLKNKFTPEKENIKAISSCKILSSGLVESALVFGEKISGSEIRSVLNLPSQNFEIEYKNAEYTITTYGYGHGVGMSQNGANYMAKQGYSYKKILNHFYSNINLIQN